MSAKNCLFQSAKSVKSVATPKFPNSANLLHKTAKSVKLIYIKFAALTVQNGRHETGDETGDVRQET